MLRLTFSQPLLGSSLLLFLLSSLGSHLVLAASVPSFYGAHNAATLSKRQGSPAPGSLDADALTRQHYGNDAAWYRDRIPLFDSSDPRLNAVYYYRWQIFRSHQRDLGERGYISTEFIDDVSWQLEPWASLNDATGFHIGEGRWSRDRRFADDYLTFMYTGGNDRHFSDYMADTAYGKYLVDGDGDFLTRHLDAMVSLYDQWGDHIDTFKGLYFIEPLLDATEYTISSIDASGGRDGFGGGSAFRPSINSYMYANARAIAAISKMTGNTAQADLYNRRADDIKNLVQCDLWNSTLSHFIDRHQTENEFVKYYEPIRGRELVGLVPWTFSLPDNDPTYSAAWSHILNNDELKGPAGLRTVEPSYEYYMRQYRYEGTQPECQWNGPIWPFQTTQALLGLANLLNSYTQSTISTSDYVRLLREYAQLHYQGDLLDLEEDYYPDSRVPIVGLARSHHYFHSGFVDLVLGGLVGIRAQADDTVAVNPLVDGSIGWFRADNVAYHGHLLSVVWDSDGSKYGQGRGLTVYLDGVRAASNEGLSKLTIDVPRRGNAAIERKIAQSIQLVRNQVPIATASSNSDNAEGLHEVIDGRVWFFNEPAHGWTSAASPSAETDQWLNIDFGSTKTLSSAELAFFGDGNVRAPTDYRIQRLDGSNWTDINLTTKDAPTENGITNVAWDAVQTSQLRVVFRQEQGRSVRLIEAKVF